MKLIILNKDLITVDNVEKYESILWTDRYSAFGDFEIYSDYMSGMLTNAIDGYYVQCNMSDRTMIIEETYLEYDPDKGMSVPIKGRSLESILTRRIVWTQTTLSGNLQLAIQRLLNENAISPTDTNRQIPNLVFKVSTNPIITALNVSAQFTGDVLYEAIASLCDAAKIGFKMTINATNKFEFELVTGKDRSYDQSINPFVTFSPNFENLKSSNYMRSSKTYKNVALVAGEGEGIDRKTFVVGSGIGLDRHELFVDARDLSTEVEGTAMPIDQYNNILSQRGTEKLSECIMISAFEGEADNTKMYSYGIDFFIGDIVQIENVFSTKSRISEIVMSEDESGFKMIPTFTQVQ